MNFSPFGVPLSAALPVATQFSAGKITQSVTTPNGQVVGVLQGGENGVHYIRPLDASAFAQASSSQSTNQQGQTLITLPITMPGAKPGDPQQTVQIQVVNPNPVSVSQGSPNSSPKYHISQIPIQTFGQGATVLTVAYNSNQENGIQIIDGQNAMEGMTVVAALNPQDIQLIQAQTEPDKSGNKEQHGPAPVALIKTELAKMQEEQEPEQNEQNQQEAAAITIQPQYIQSANLHDYIQKIQNSQLPLSLHQFLKFNGPNGPEVINIKKEIGDDITVENVGISPDQEHLILGSGLVDAGQDGIDETNEKGKKKKKYKKKPPKPKKPKPGQVHIATALDGTTLFCCPECHMAYPEKELLEQHLVGHKIERRFICDICGAGLKRKEHLERHKLGHNPERPFVCSVCLKGFKRKEHLNLHFVIHSGEKTEICGECGKGFYRKDHLRKHARSHITRRAKELAEKTQLGYTKVNNNESGGSGSAMGTAQVTIQVGDEPNSQIQIPVQIQVPQHQIQVSENAEEESSTISTVVLPNANDEIQILPN